MKGSQSQDPSCPACGAEDLVYVTNADEAENRATCLACGWNGQPALRLTPAHYRRYGKLKLRPGASMGLSLTPEDGLGLQVGDVTSEIGWVDAAHLRDYLNEVLEAAGIVRGETYEPRRY